MSRLAMPPRAGVLPTSTELLGEISFRQGERVRNPRKGETRVVRFIVNEAFDVLRDELLRFLDEPPFTTNGLRLLEPNIYIKASKNAGQAAYELLDRYSFELLLRERWSYITQADVDQLARGESDPVWIGRLVAAAFSFQLFMYVSDPRLTAEPAPRRVKARRTLVTTQARTSAGTNNRIETQARWPPQGTPAQLPTRLADDSTSRPACASNAPVQLDPTTTNHLVWTQARGQRVVLQFILPTRTLRVKRVL